MSRRPQAILFAAVWMAACGGEGRTDATPEGVEPPRRIPSVSSTPLRTGSPNARPQMARELQRDMITPRHPSDGKGTVSLVEGPEAVTVGDRARFVFEYTAGEHGIAVGGALYFMGSPFWGWSPPQVLSEGRPGFTRVRVANENVRPRVSGFSPQGLVIQLMDAPLAAGETIILEYGVGPMGTRVDSYTERRSTFWFAVDGDGDGVRENLPSCPYVRIAPGPPTRIHAVWPSRARPKETVSLKVVALDAGANAAELDAVVELSVVEGSADAVAIADVPRMSGGTATIPVTLKKRGLLRIRARVRHGETTFEAVSNPLLVSSESQPLYWVDLHGHSAHSDGTGAPADYYHYARHTAGLDAAALTDHDHFGLPALDRTPRMWRQIREAAQRLDAPGRFLALVGYEWTSWLYGHQHVVFFGESSPLLSSLDERYRTPKQLWDALASHDALAFVHHTAGAPVATDWSFAPLESVAPCAEVSSVHGFSEAADVDRPLSGFIRGQSVRDALNRGYRLGLIGGGDTHDGHPGLGHLGPHYGYRRDENGETMGNGGIAAVIAERLDRASLLAALRARRVYGTSGPRILLHATLDGREMGRVIPVRDLSKNAALKLFVAGTAPIKRIDVIRSGAVARDIAPVSTGITTVRLKRPIHPPSPGEYLYVRVLQEDGAHAWSSPFFFE